MLIDISRNSPILRCSILYNRKIHYLTREFRVKLHAKTDIARIAKRWLRYRFSSAIYHRFRWYATLENKTPAETFPKFPSVLRVVDRSDRNSPITATSVTFWPSLRLASGLWLVNFDPICHNTKDWRKFWKRFRGCFVFQSHDWIE